MTVSVSPLSLAELHQLPAHSRRCVFWEIEPAVAKQTQQFSDPVFEKEAWLSMVMLEWGSCGQIATIAGEPVGCAIYAPPGAVPRAGLFPTSPVSPDAVLLTTLRAEEFLSAESLTGRLVQAVIADLVRRGVRALEAFGLREDESIGPVWSRQIIGSGALSLAPQQPPVPRATAARECSPENCMIPVAVLEEAGFKVVAEHRRFPRLRLEIEHDHGWKEDVERALDQLLAAAVAEQQKAGVCA